MNITINTSGLDQWMALPPEQMFWVFLGNFGWIIIAIVFLWGVLKVYELWIKQQWAKTHKHILLAVDIPRGNEQTPKAAENMFTYLGGAHGTQNFFEKWFLGEYQKSFSYEIISVEGYTQFLIWTPLESRNLLETSVYSQYPDAEISEVDDYTKNVPQKWPDEEYDIWGTEFLFQTKWVYPLKGYLEFEHTMGPSETQFKDPMASLMDLCGSLRQSEQFWFQLIVQPTGFDWIKESEKEIDKILERKKKVDPSYAMRGLEALGNASETVFPIWQDIDPSKKKEEKRPRSMMDLSPLEKRRIEGIELKASKLGFLAKIRVVYIAKKDVFNKAKVANGIVGYIKQFASMDLNGLKPDLDHTMTRTAYFLKEMRLNEKKRLIFHHYLKRSDTRGLKMALWNIEELATLWHFPIEANVKIPLVQKAPGRKADAPAALPLAPKEEKVLPDIFSGLERGAGRAGRAGQNRSEATTVSAADDLTKKDAAPPPNLPTA